MPINKLEQLRKYIFGIELERIKFQKKKFNLSELVNANLFRSKVYREGFIRFYDSSFNITKSQKVCCCHFETLQSKDRRSNV